MSFSRTATGAAYAAFMLSAACASGQPVPDYDFSWSTITHPGNRPAHAQEAPNAFQPLGSVDYEYRISQTEVTVSQWFEFVQAYAPHYNGALGDTAFTSIHIGPTTSDPRGPYAIVPGEEQYPAKMSWRFAARYVNWLNNNKRLDAAAFETGAYETSTFVNGGPGNHPQDQANHAPGARFWIPTNDEWTKAVFYDPSRYGPGNDGYWPYPNRSLWPLVPGLPGMGGQTSAGTNLLYFPVGSYPTVNQPWGLLDSSGGAPEWTETLSNNILRTRVVRGSGTGLGSETGDLLDYWIGGGADGAEAGLRLASVIPASSTATILLPLTYLIGRRRRQREKLPLDCRSSCGDCDRARFRG
ncbi:MAG: SUMF1/EgtB/PvdO family nonheme iron enzyme [Phycisphaerales bacterium]|nr:SUMF1/EgtB/PvdO family nonheme iron enzyme [Phycisphaerales bacterium]